MASTSASKYFFNPCAPKAPSATDKAPMKAAVLRNPLCMVRLQGLRVIYATAPVQRIVGFAKIARVTQGTPTQLWRLTQEGDGGISRSKLFAYLGSSRTGVAIELSKVTPMPGGIDPRLCLGRGFRPPQSFRYLSEKEISQINSSGKK